MRRKDREVTDIERILAVIDECEILRLGIADGDFPYIVPVNFGYSEDGGKIAFYIHGAQAGRKYELLTKNKRCSFEMDVPLTLEQVGRDFTMRYRSVMGTAEAELLTGEEKERAMDDFIMTRHDATRGFDYNKAELAVTAVFKLTVTSITGKINEKGAD